jgi:hypothetical protein
LEETLSFLKDRNIGLLRPDSGFYDQKIFDCLEEEGRHIDCITAVPMYVSIQRKIAVQRAWLGIENGIEICEFEYLGQDWLKSRRLIAVRQKIAVRPWR